MSQVPVCAKCRLQMRCKKNDFIVEEMADTTFPYRIWLTDLYACPSCGAEVVTGFAKQPWGEHFQPDYAAKAVQVDLRYWPRADMVPKPLVCGHQHHFGYGSYTCDREKGHEGRHAQGGCEWSGQFAHIEPQRAGDRVVHIDGDPRNNEPSNLRIETVPVSFGVGKRKL